MHAMISNRKFDRKNKRIFRLSEPQSHVWPTLKPQSFILTHLSLVAVQITLDMHRPTPLSASRPYPRSFTHWHKFTLILTFIRIYKCTIKLTFNLSHHSINLSPGSQAHGLTVDTPCVLALIKSSSQLIISMAKPDNVAANVTVKTPWGLKTKRALRKTPLEGVNCNADGSVTVRLPGAPRAGATVTVSCDLDL